MSGRESSRPAQPSLSSRLWQIAMFPVDDLLPFDRIPSIVLPGYRHLLKTCLLPDEAKTFIRTIVRRTRLWRREKRDVAKELIAHFEDGIESDKTACDLITQFGDVKNAIRLIRRSKKRSRQLIWQAWKRSWQVTGIAIACIVGLYGFSAARMWLSSPSPSHDYFADMNAIPAAIPEAERAWPVYREALIAMNVDIESIGTSLGVRPDNEEWPIVEHYVNRHQDSIALLRQAAAIPGLGFEIGLRYQVDDLPLVLPGASTEVYAAQAKNNPPVPIYPRLLMGAYLTHLQPLRRAAGLLEADAFLAADRGDGLTLVADLQAMIQTAEKLGEIPMSINGLVGIAILSRTIDSAQILLHDDPALFSDDDLIRLAHQFATYAGGGPIRIDLEGQRASFLDILQHTYTDNGHGDGYLTAEGAGLMAWLERMYTVPQETNEERVWKEVFKTARIPAVGFMMADRRDMVDMFSSLFDAAVRESQTPLWKRTESTVQRRIEELSESSLDSLRYWPVVQLIPGIHLSIGSSEKLTQMRDGLLVAIAIELHRRRTGSWPTSLEEVSTSILPTVPRDRFDGGPIKYRLVDGEPVIYSVGSDLDDDGGRLFEPDEKSKRWNDPLSDRYKSLLAARWFPPEKVKAIKQAKADGRSPAEYLPNADWILWPPQRGE